jgi:GAF domain-containing protein
MPKVRVKTGQNAGLTYEVGDAPLLLGRDDRAEIQILDQGVSRRHAEIFRMGEMYFIRDLDSRNGTFVNEDRVKEELLRDGDEVRIGSTIVAFEDSPPGGTPVPPVARRVRTSEGSDATTTIHLEEVFAGDVDDLAEPATSEQKDLRVLYRAAHVISEAKDPSALLETFVRLVGEALRADHACIFLRKEGTREFELEAGWQPESLIARGAPVVSTRVIQECVQTSRAKLSVEDKSSPSPDPTASAFGIGRPRAVIVAPLVALDQLHGVIYCASQEGADRFTKESLDLLTALAFQLGIALQGLLASQRQERILISAVRTLASALEMREQAYAGHSARVGGYCAGIAQALKIPKSEMRRIQLAALLHNIGKIALPPGVADDESNPEHIQKRVDMTERLIRKMEGLEYLLPVVRHYTERMDGTGLPDRLPAEKIPLAARILAVADRLDTLMVRGDPPDFQRLSLKDALLKIRGESPHKLDVRVVDALIVAHRGGYLLSQQERIK